VDGKATRDLAQPAEVKTLDDDKVDEVDVRRRAFEPLNAPMPPACCMPIPARVRSLTSERRISSYTPSSQQQTPANKRARAK